MRRSSSPARCWSGSIAAVVALVAAACSDDAATARARDAGPDGAAPEVDGATPGKHPADAANAIDRRAPATAPGARDGGTDAATQGDAASDGRALHGIVRDASNDATTGEGGAAPDAADVDAGRIRSLWNGVDLTEWEGDPMIWKVVDGAIVGTAPSGYLTVPSYLIYRGQVPGDFVLTADAWLAMGGNSGIQYRSERFDTMGYRVRGYQIDMGTNYWGQLYDDGHGIARAASGACLLHANFDTWIAYEVRAVGANLLHRIDGIQCVSYVDTSGTPALSGIVALQYHPPGGYEVRFKNLRLEAL